MSPVDNWKCSSEAPRKEVRPRSGDREAIVTSTCDSLRQGSKWKEGSRRAAKRTRQGQLPEEPRVGEEPEEVRAAGGEPGDGSGVPEAERSGHRVQCHGGGRRVRQLGGPPVPVLKQPRWNVRTNAKPQWVMEGEEMEALNKEPVFKNFAAGEGLLCDSRQQGSRIEGAPWRFSLLHNNILTLKDQTIS